MRAVAAASSRSAQHVRAALEQRGAVAHRQRTAQARLLLAGEGLRRQRAGRLAQQRGKPEARAFALGLEARQRRAQGVGLGLRAHGVGRLATAGGHQLAHQFSTVFGQPGLLRGHLVLVRGGATLHRHAPSRRPRRRAPRRARRHRLRRRPARLRRARELAEEVDQVGHREPASPMLRAGIFSVLSRLSPDSWVRARCPRARPAAGSRPPPRGRWRWRGAGWRRPRAGRYWRSAPAAPAGRARHRRTGATSRRAARRSRPRPRPGPVRAVAGERAIGGGRLHQRLRRHVVIGADGGAAGQQRGDQQRQRSRARVLMSGSAAPRPRRLPAPTPWRCGRTPAARRPAPRRRRCAPAHAAPAAPS